MKIEKKFYVSHPRMRDPQNNWTHATEKEAIAHAKRLLNDNVHDEMQFIVKIIKVVKRKETPMVVESVT
jgi:hypothetical protein